MRNGTDGYGIATKLSKKRKRLVLTPDLRNMKYRAVRHSAGQNEINENRGNSDCMLYVYDSLENKSGVSAAVQLRIPHFWDKTLRQRVTGSRHFGATKCPYLQGSKRP